MTNQLIYDVGVNDLHESAKRSIPRKVWGSILTRVYCSKYHAKYPTYQNVALCDDWHVYSNFKAWFSDQYYDKTLTLDKDMLSGSTKIYSPDTCVFVPQYVNNIFMRCGIEYRNSVETLLGVTKTKYNKYEVYGYDVQARRRKYLGVYSNEIDAHHAWIDAKRNQLRDAIYRYRQEYCYDVRVDKVLSEFWSYLDTTYVTNGIITSIEY